MPSKPKKPTTPKKTKTAPEAAPRAADPVVRVDFAEPPEPAPAPTPMVVTAPPAPRMRLEDLRVEAIAPAEPAPKPKGLPRLDGKRIVIAGGTGKIGSYLTAVCLATGATVIVPSRSEERLKTLKARLSDSVVDRFVPLVGSVGDELASQLGRVDGVVAAFGRFWEGPQATRVALEDWNRILSENLTAHFVAARTLIPLIHAGAKGGSYIIVNGPAGEAPNIRSAPVAVASAGLSTLAKVLGDEVSGTGVVVEELIFSSARERAHWLSIDGLAREVLQILATRTRTK